MSEVELGLAIIATINAAIRFSVPITLGALSGIMGERSGIVNIGIEGMMLMAAFTGYMTNVALSKDSVDPDLRQASVRLGLALAVALLTGGADGAAARSALDPYKVGPDRERHGDQYPGAGPDRVFLRDEIATISKLPAVIGNPFGKDSSWELKLADRLRFICRMTSDVSCLIRSIIPVYRAGLLSSADAVPHYLGPAHPLHREGIRALPIHSVSMCTECSLPTCLSAGCWPGWRVRS
jgi:hypothetical protein